MPQNEMKIFKYQFILNYLSKANSIEKQRYLMEIFSHNPNWTNTVFKELMPTLQTRKTKQKVENKGEINVTVERTSKFI